MDSGVWGAGSYSRRPMEIPTSNLIVRCSSLSKLMTSSRSKSDPLSETCKSYVMEQAKEQFYGIISSPDTKFFKKGHMNENLGIEMVNTQRFTMYKKNEIRLNNGWLTGECDVNTGSGIIDIKCSWSFDSFPAFVSEAEKIAKKSGYDWQMRGYMMLYDLPKAEVIWCMTSTPDSLLSPYDDKSVHKVDHIDPDLRMTSFHIERDLEIEKQMKERYDVANVYYKECIKELKNKNQYAWK